jgi:Arc/MetJ-type ribon-helix-helix transcriptional regulator
MARTSRKLNFLIEEALCRELEQLVPSGKRSQVVNDALRKELERIRRKLAVEAIKAGPSEGRRFSSREIVERLAQDRSSH